MMTALTDEDRAAIATAWQEYKKIDPRKANSSEPSEGGIRQHFYIAGVAAERERCAKICEQSASYTLSGYDAAMLCAELIRMKDKP